MNLECPVSLARIDYAQWMIFFLSRFLINSFMTQKHIITENIVTDNKTHLTFSINLISSHTMLMKVKRKTVTTFFFLNQIMRRSYASIRFLNLHPKNESEIKVNFVYIFTCCIVLYTLLQYFTTFTFYDNIFMKRKKRL